MLGFKVFVALILCLFFLIFFLFLVGVRGC
jgi:hypothetical protein